MANPFKKKIPVRSPVILTTEQLEAVLQLHSLAGSHCLKAVHYEVCACGVTCEGWGEKHRRHIAEEISRLQV